MDVNTDVGEWLSAVEIAKLKLPGYPTSARRVHDRAKREQWESRETPSPGRTGNKREYRPPAAVMALIQRRISEGLRNTSAEPGSRYSNAQATKIGKSFAKTLHTTGESQGAPFLNVSCLARLLDAIDAVSLRIGKPLTTLLRMAALVHAYRTLRERVIADPLDPVAYMRLGPQDFEAAATLALSDALIVVEEGSLVSDPYRWVVASL